MDDSLERDGYPVQTKKRPSFNDNSASSKSNSMIGVEAESTAPHPRSARASLLRRVQRGSGATLRSAGATLLGAALGYLMISCFERLSNSKEKSIKARILAYGFPHAGWSDDSCSSEYEEEQDEDSSSRHRRARESVVLQVSTRTFGAVHHTEISLEMMELQPLKGHGVGGRVEAGSGMHGVGQSGGSAHNENDTQLVIGDEDTGEESVRWLRQQERGVAGNIDKKKQPRDKARDAFRLQVSGSNWWHRGLEETVGEAVAQPSSRRHEAGRRSLEQVRDSESVDNLQLVGVEQGEEAAIRRPRRGGAGNAAPQEVAVRVAPENNFGDCCRHDCRCCTVSHRCMSVVFLVYSFLCMCSAVAVHVVGGDLNVRSMYASLFLGVAFAFVSLYVSFLHPCLDTSTDN